MVSGFKRVAKAAMPPNIESSSFSKGYPEEVSSDVTLLAVAFHRIAHGPDSFCRARPATLLGAVWTELANGRIRLRLNPKSEVE